MRRYIDDWMMNTNTNKKGAWAAAAKAPRPRLRTVATQLSTVRSIPGECGAVGVCLHALFFPVTEIIFIDLYGYMASWQPNPNRPYFVGFSFIFPNNKQYLNYELHARPSLLRS